MNDKYLPMGTVVILKKGSKKLMIFGRKQMDTATQKEYDYISYLYPEGNIKKDLAIQKAVEFVVKEAKETKAK